MINKKNRESLATEGAGGGSAQKGCRVCGSMAKPLYQNQTCKSCLLKSFQKVVPMIDYYRSGMPDQGATRQQ